MLILFSICCTVVDSGEVGIRFHKWSLNEQDYGGVEGTCKGWVFYNPITTNVFTYPTFTQRKQYETFSVNAKDASLFEMDPTIAYRINPEKACDIFTKYRVGVKELEEGYIRTCIYEAYRTCANQYTSDSLMSNRANFAGVDYRTAHGEEYQYKYNAATDDGQRTEFPIHAIHFYFHND